LPNGDSTFFRVLSWPPVYCGFSLQCSEDLASDSWTDCISGVAIIGNKFFVTNALSTGAAFSG
jgi:hypothetical protein